MPNAARLGDSISHNPSSENARFLRGAFLGAAIGVGAVGLAAAVTIGTGGVAAVAIMGAAIGAGFGTFLDPPKPKKGTIITGSPNVFFNNKPAARVKLDMASCAKDPGNQPLKTGSSTFFINNMPAARVGDKVDCKAVIIEGSPDIIIGGGTAYAPGHDMSPLKSISIGVLAAGVVITETMVITGIDTVKAYLMEVFGVPFIVQKAFDVTEKASDMSGGFEKIGKRTGKRISDIKDMVD